MSQRATDGCIFNADPCAADDAVEAAFFTQPSNRLAMTLPAFRASRLISTSSNDSRNGLPLWARTVLAIHLLGVNRVSQRAKRSLSILALFLNGTCGSARRFPTSASTNRTPVLPTMTPTAFGMPTVAPLIRDGPSHSQFWDQYARAHARQWGVTPTGRTSVRPPTR